jgi:Uma2 family endonuclease
MALHEIVLPETKPETEWVRGRPLVKVGQTYRHGLLQVVMAASLGRWAESGRHGRVAIEWRFRVAPPGEIIRPLVPDIAYLAFTAVAADAPSGDFEVPLGAPTVAVEILSQEDHEADVADKVATYLRAGASVVLLVDPDEQTVEAVDKHRTVYRPGERFTHIAMPGYELDVEALFAELSEP